MRSSRPTRSSSSTSISSSPSPASDSGSGQGEGGDAGIDGGYAGAIGSRSLYSIYRKESAGGFQDNSAHESLKNFNLNPEALPKIQKLSFVEGKVSKQTLGDDFAATEKRWSLPETSTFVPFKLPSTTATDSESLGFHQSQMKALPKIRPAELHPGYAHTANVGGFDRQLKEISTESGLVSSLNSNLGRIRNIPEPVGSFSPVLVKDISREEKGVLSFDLARFQLPQKFSGENNLAKKDGLESQLECGFTGLSRRNFQVPQSFYSGSLREPVKDSTSHSESLASPMSSRVSAEVFRSNVIPLIDSSNRLVMSNQGKSAQESHLDGVHVDFGRTYQLPEGFQTSRISGYG